MKNTHFTPALLVIAALLGACASTPTSTGLLEQTRVDFQVAQSNPKVATYAPMEMKTASDAMQRANAAATDNDSVEEVDRLAYLAKQKIALTQEVAKQKSAEADVTSAAVERDQLRLDQRTMEADQATRAAQLAQRNAALAQRETMVARERAANLEAQLEELAAKKTERGIVITFGDVLFGTDLAYLTPDGMRTAQKLATVLQQNPQRMVLVEGFTDSTGSTAHNQELSERRATSVRSALQEQGIAAQRIAIRGYGESYPVASNDTNMNRQLNRRVEIVLSNGNEAIRQR